MNGLSFQINSDKFDMLFTIAFKKCCKMWKKRFATIVMSLILTANPLVGTAQGLWT